MNQRKNNFSDIEFLLGPNWYDGYQIVEHRINDSDKLASCCFEVWFQQISDGDGFPTRFNDSFVRIEEKDYHHVMGIFRKATEMMCDIGEKACKPLDRPIAAGDYLYYCGEYVHINSISEVTGEYWGEDFNGDQYDITLCYDTDWITGENCPYDEKEDLNEFKLITRVEFEKAHNVAKSAIIEATDYLKKLYISNHKSYS